MCKQVCGECDALYISESGKVVRLRSWKNLPNIMRRAVCLEAHAHATYLSDEWICYPEGNGRAKTNAYISGSVRGKDGKPLDVGMDIFIEVCACLRITR